MNISKQQSNSLMETQFSELNLNTIFRVELKHQFSGELMR